MRARLHEELNRLGDIAFTPNSLRAPGEGYATFYDRMHADPAASLAINEAAWLASSADTKTAAAISALAASPNAVIRYWAGTALARLAYAGLDREAVRTAASALLTDAEPQVRVAAAEALGALGDVRAIPALLGEVQTNSGAAREALGAIETLGPERAAAAGDELMRLNARKTSFFLRSALITLGRLPYSELYPKGLHEESEG